MTSIDLPTDPELAVDARNADETSPLLNLPQEIVLHILSYLDIYELDCLATLSPILNILSSDPILHRHRLRVVTPSRIGHSLFAQGCHGLLRPTIADLVRMNVMRGIGIERRWRLGIYFYSVQSVKLYESSLRLEHARIVRVLTVHLTKRATPTEQADPLNNVILPSETNSHQVSRRLLPVIARLKWSMKRDGLARRVRAGHGQTDRGTERLRWWLEGGGRVLVHDSERIRLAVCPGVRKFVRLFEGLAAGDAM